MSPRAVEECGHCRDERLPHAAALLEAVAVVDAKRGDGLRGAVVPNPDVARGGEFAFGIGRLAAFADGMAETPRGAVELERAAVAALQAQERAGRHVAAPVHFEEDAQEVRGQVDAREVAGAFAERERTAEAAAAVEVERHHAAEGGVAGEEEVLVAEVAVEEAGVVHVGAELRDGLQALHEDRAGAVRGVEVDEIAVEAAQVRDGARGEGAAGRGGVAHGEHAKRFRRRNSARSEVGGSGIRALGLRGSAKQVVEEAPQARGRSKTLDDEVAAIGRRAGHKERGVAAGLEDAGVGRGEHCAERLGGSGRSPGRCPPFRYVLCLLDVAPNLRGEGLGRVERALVAETGIEI